jgi:thiosulfate/3-mercaptopyruvate sulfurtransferase
VLDADDAADYGQQHLLLDARPGDRFHGRNETIDPVAGHIPGAVSAPALANLRDDGRFLTPDDLAVQFTQVGVRPGAAVGVYCGSGVQAMHTALALEASEVGVRPAVYVGSWSHWITDPDRPIET